jgi:outer membrane immunogenic protein
MAADMPVRAPLLKAPPPPAVYNWTGIYTASSLGGGWEDITGNYVLPPTTDHHSENTTRAWYGSHLGAQYQWNNLAFGVEGSYETPIGRSFGTSLSQSPDCLLSTANRTCGDRFRNLWDVGGKLGMAWDRWMVYGIGGFATVRLDTRTQATSTGAILSQSSEHHDGWFIGAGADVFVTKFWMSDVILGVQYKHYDFESIRHFAAAPGALAPLVPDGNTRDMSGRLDVLTARLTFKYSVDAAPVRAAY